MTDEVKVEVSVPDAAPEAEEPQEAANPEFLREWIRAELEKLRAESEARETRFREEAEREREAVAARMGEELAAQREELYMLISFVLDELGEEETEEEPEGTGEMVEIVDVPEAPSPPPKRWWEI